MSKRLNKRQQREQEELEQLRAQESAVPAAPEPDATSGDEVKESSDVDEEEATGPAPVNPFAALGGEDDQDDEDESEEEAPAVTTTKKSKKKKPKKKKKAPAAGVIEDEDTAPATPASTKSKKKKGQPEPSAELDGMDEVDRALAELNMKNGESSTTPAITPATVAENRRFMAFRNLMSVDPKNLDADAELRRFFGSKVIASSAPTGSRSHRPTASSKLRYTISKPKPNYPPATSLAGLTMREMTEEEVVEAYERRGIDGGEDKGEKWFTFEHNPVWREIERQFMGAVRSHDPNELMALLQVYPWHVDTLLQMSEVYRLQSDIGAASDYAERALYAFDRCLLPGFNVSSGACRLDFDRVENRPMFTGLHRIISYLGRRGCWLTAFNFAKLLFSLDPFGDPHGAALWLDFLAVKSGNGEWLISMLEQAATTPAAAVWHGYPGIAYAQALALRADEMAKKHGVHHESESALADAMKTFPQVIIPLADKIGASIPGSARSHPLLKLEAGYSETPQNVIHLLSHIYVSRSEALWKEPDLVKFFENAVKAALAEIDSSSAKDMRDDALAMVQTPRDPVDEEINVPLFICRHVVCSESTSWLGFLPPVIRNRPVNAFDPLPPSTSITDYDADYFSGAKPSRRRGGPESAAGGRAGLMEGFMERLTGAMEGGGEGWQERVAEVWRDLTGRREFAGMPQGERDGVLEQLLQLGGQLTEDQRRAGGGGMPGGFPGGEDDQ